MAWEWKWSGNETTVGRHLSELQLSKYVGYPYAFSKATPTISGYFRRVSGLTLPVIWQLKTQDNLPQEMETEQRPTFVRILVITTYTVSGSSLADP